MWGFSGVLLLVFGSGNAFTADLKREAVQCDDHAQMSEEIDFHKVTNVLNNNNERWQSEECVADQRCNLLEFANQTVIPFLTDIGETLPAVFDRQLLGFFLVAYFAVNHFNPDSSPPNL